MLKFTAGVIVTLLIVLVIGGGFLLGKSKNDIITRPVPQNKTSTTPAATVINDKTATASSDSFDKMPTGFVNPSATIDAIETSIQTKVYTNFEPYMPETIIVTLGASECCGTLTKNETIQQLSYLNQATAPWNFTATNPIAQQLIEKDPANFKDTIVGTSANRYAAAFKLRDDYLIEKIFIIADYNLILGE